MGQEAATKLSNAGNKPQLICNTKSPQRYRVNTAREGENHVNREVAPEYASFSTAATWRSVPQSVSEDRLSAEFEPIFSARTPCFEKLPTPMLRRNNILSQSRIAWIEDVHKINKNHPLLLTFSMSLCRQSFLVSAPPHPPSAASSKGHDVF